MVNKSRIFFPSLTFIFFISAALISCQDGSSEKNKITIQKKEESNYMNNDTLKLEKATFGAGCFWCVEAVFQRVEGVKTVISGYEGGTLENPSYEDVCTGTTGHAEVCEILFDSSVVSYGDLLEVFWKTHDPTTLNRQGNDAGTQYRSVVFYHSDKQKEAAEYYRKRLEDEKIFDKPIVTQIVPAGKFFKAEAYHQNYYNTNPRQGYCAFVITPKVEKFEKIFKDKLKSSR